MNGTSGNGLLNDCHNLNDCGSILKHANETNQTIHFIMIYFESNSWCHWALRLCGSPALKGIVHFEINCWYVLAYLKGIQDVGVFVFTVFSILIFFGQTVVYQSYKTGIEGPPTGSPQRACTDKSKLNMISW